MRKIFLLKIIFLLSLFNTILLANEITKEREEIIKLYIATFNRAPDFAGLEYWYSEMENKNWTLEMVAKSMFHQEETKRVYPKSSNLTFFINSIYKNVLNREADKDGLEYWIKEIESGNIERENMIISLLNGAIGDDIKTLYNKIEIAKYFAVEKRLNDVEVATLIMKMITDKNSSVDFAKKRIDEIIEKPYCKNLRLYQKESFNDIFPNDNILWSAKSESVEEIREAFNFARSRDNTINKKLVMPPQSVWDLMSYQQQGFYLLNQERIDRGLEPFEGIYIDIEKISQAYAIELYYSGKFEHNADDTPSERIDRVATLKEKKESVKEAIFLNVKDDDYLQNPVIKAVYNWIYSDKDNNWSNRKALFSKLSKNSGKNGIEGLIGFGFMRVKDYAPYNGKYTTIIVLNIVDVNSLNSIDLIKTGLCSNSDIKVLESEKGIASFMDTELNGLFTATGELFDRNIIAAAHKSYPLGSMVRVTNLENNKTIIVRINDRGPYVKGRIIDLTRKAAEILDYIEEGLIDVKIERVKY